mmetsp:Transcript_7643/g.13555  ORF Transcript_7643/g.13555 Transcript_7643/m.13555 type:complete len:183 (+) Transcript_7643:197-745(+)
MKGRRVLWTKVFGGLGGKMMRRSSYTSMTMNHSTTLMNGTCIIDFLLFNSKRRLIISKMPKPRAFWRLNRRMVLNKASRQRGLPMKMASSLLMLLATEEGLEHALKVSTGKTADKEIQNNKSKWTPQVQHSSQNNKLPAGKGPTKAGKGTSKAQPSGDPPVDEKENISTAAAALEFKMYGKM